MSRLQVVIAEDELLTRLGIQNLLEACAGDWQVVGMVGDGNAALEALRELKPDVVLLDLNMPVLSGVEVLRRIAADGLNVTPIVLTFHEEFDLVRSSLRLGAFDYILKSELSGEKLDALLTRVYEDRLQRGILALQTALPDGDSQLMRLLHGDAASVPTWPEQGYACFVFQLEDAAAVAQRYEDGGMHTALLSLLDIWRQEIRANCRVLLSADTEITVLFDAEQFSPALPEDLCRLAADYLNMDFRRQDGGIADVPEQLAPCYARAVATLTAAEDSPLTAQMKEFIRSHYRENLSVHTLAHTFFLSENHISRVFNRCAGMSIPDYINKLRIEEACRLLADPKIKVYEVAQQVGFHSDAYFCTTFKRIMGYPPSRRKEEQL